MIKIKLFGTKLASHYLGQGSKIAHAELQDKDRIRHEDVFPQIQSQTMLWISNSCSRVRLYLEKVGFKPRSNVSAVGLLRVYVLLFCVGYWVSFLESSFHGDLPTELGFNSNETSVSRCTRIWSPVVLTNIMAPC